MSVTRNNASRGTALVNTAGSPDPRTVDSIMQQLLRDPDYVIEVVVNNNFSAVANRYTVATGKVVATASELTAALQGMRRRGERAKVLYSIAVPWEYRGNTALEQAVSALRSEASALMTDPAFSGTAKNLPVDNIASLVDEINAIDTSGNAGSDTDQNSQFWNSLPGILTGLGGLVGAFTGNVPPATGTGVAAPPPAPSTNWLGVTLWVLGIGVVVTVVVLIVRAKK